MVSSRVTLAATAFIFCLVAGDLHSQERCTMPTPTATLAGHQAHVWGVAFSPDGKTLASGAGGTLGEPGELKLWDVKSGRELVSLVEPCSIRWVAFSPDGKTLATAEHDNTAKLRDARTGKVLRGFKGHQSGLDTVSFSPDGKTLATSSWDRTAKIWDVQTGEEVRTLRGHAREVYTVAFSSDGRQLATGCHDGTAKVWQAMTGEEQVTLRGHTGVVHCVAFCPDGKVVASAGWDRTVRLWDAQKGNELAVLKGHTVQALAVAFSPDGKLLASVSGRWGDYNYEPGPGEIKLWDTITHKELASVPGHTDRIFAVAFAPDGKTLATGSWDKTVKTWDVAKMLAAGQ